MAVSGSKRYCPRPSELIIHLQEERALRTTASHPEKPIVQPRGIRMQWRFPLEPDPLGGPSKHSHNFRIRYCWPSRMLPDQHHLWKGLAHLPMQQSTSDRQGEQRRIQVVPHERVQPVPSAAPLAVKWKEGLVPWRGVPHITVRPVWLLPEVAPLPAATRGSPRSRRRHGHPVPLLETESGLQVCNGHFLAMGV